MKSNIFGRIPFKCNVCGSTKGSRRRAKDLLGVDYEVLACVDCGSGPRHREIAHALSAHLYGRTYSIPDFPASEAKGIGLSEGGCLSRLVERLPNYKITYYHKEPRLDITDNEVEGLDFLIACDVFEHVEPPVSRAFKTAARMLKPGGFMIFSTNYEEAGDTVEHYPELYDYQATRTAVINRTRDGRVQRFDRPVFHGGEGFLLEMRLFSRSGLVREFREAGFDVEFIARDISEHGIYSRYNPSKGYKGPHYRWPLILARKK